VFATLPEELETVQNIFIVAASHDLEIDAIRHGEHAQAKLAESLFRGYLEPSRYDLSGGVVFTDDYNPVEYLVARSL
jgi:stage V sporulation protein SpoVS